MGLERSEKGLSEPEGEMWFKSWKGELRKSISTLETLDAESASNIEWADRELYHEIYTPNFGAKVRNSAEEVQKTVELELKEFKMQSMVNFIVERFLVSIVIRSRRQEKRILDSLKISGV